MQLTATDDFAVTWPDPEMAEAPWVGDRMHFPGPTVHLAQFLIGNFQERVLSAPAVFANGYEFSLPPTIPDPPPEVMERGLAVWHEDYAPRLREFCERVRNTDFDSMSTRFLADAFDKLGNEALECFRLTLIVVKRFMGPTMEMIQFLEEELGADGPALAGRVLQGSQNATSASGEGLDKLTAIAARSPQIAATLREGHWREIAGLPGGDEFLGEFARFIAEFGWRAETWGTFHTPTWAEDHSQPMSLVGRYLADPENGPSALARRAAADREAAVREIESRLAPEKLPAFRKMVEETHSHVAVSEDRARWQLSLVGVMRIPALALGRKLVEAGALDEPGDVFYLTWEDALRAAQEPGQWTAEKARKGRADYARWEELNPPPFLGSPPDLSQMPPEMLPIIKHFFGLTGEMPEFGPTLKGFAASPGTVRGRARVIRHLDDADRLEQGDILVCVSTAPPWTALFAIAGGVVTDTGGVMSHSAICAREFAIPGVVGTQVGTAAIQDGAMITIDGDAGTVTLVDE